MGPSIELAEFERLLGCVTTAKDFWILSRTLLRSYPYVGPTLGLLAVAKFGAERVVPWQYVDAELFTRSHFNFPELLRAEAALTASEQLRREEILAERRAEIPAAYA